MSDDVSDRAKAKASAAAIRASIADPAKAGKSGIIHVDMHRPRRGLWYKTWINLPGLLLELASKTYSHRLLPGWEYTPQEMKTEMLADLERYADTGLQPKVATRPKAGMLL